MRVIPNPHQEREKASLFFILYACIYILDGYRPGIRGIDTDTIAQPLQGFVLQSMKGVDEVLDLTIDRQSHQDVDFLNKIADRIKATAKAESLDKVEVYLSLCFAVQTCHKMLKLRARNGQQLKEFTAIKKVFQPLGFSFEQKHEALAIEILDAFQKAIQKKDGIGGGL